MAGALYNKNIEHTYVLLKYPESGAKYLKGGETIGYLSDTGLQQGAV